MFHKLRKVILLFFIILIAWLFRFNNVNWDSNYHLHPDERFLTMVSTAMKLPVNLSEYFNQKISLLNPSNIGYKFFVYGNFPLVINKYLAVSFKMDDYNQLTILGRQLSAFFDLLIVILVFKIVELLEKKYLPAGRQVNFHWSIKYWSAFIYAVSVLPIQLSHFFAVDSFLNFFMFGSFYFALRVGHDRPLQNTILSAIFFGLALACKVTAIFILPLNLFFLFKDCLFKRQSLIKNVFNIALFCLISYISLRIANPYYFQNQSFFNFTLSTNFISNLESLKSMTVKNINNWYPPMVQWLNKNTILHSLVNNVVFGMGIPISTLVAIGMIRVISNIKKKKYELLVILFWVIGFFAYQSMQATPTLRYFIFLYPFLAIFASLGISYLIDYKISLRGKHIPYSKIISYIFISISVLILLLWPIMFSSIYFHKNTRVEASEWIYKNLPNNSYILSEYWDDALPMSVANTYGKTFSGTQLKVFDSDTQEKWQTINQELAKADYYILSSNRGWGSVPTVPKKYPLMSKFYNDLLSDKNPNYKKIKEFTSYPQLKISNFKFQINDDWSDEGFTVYDHPKVLIFKNVKKS